MNRGTENGDGADGGDLVDLVGQLRSIIARQQRTIAEQRTELDTLRREGGAAAARGKTASPAPAANPNAPARDGGDRSKVAAAIAGSNFTIVFDGGAIGNPGRGYGSYQIVGADGLLAHERLEYGDRVTNNQAEYRTLIEALEDLRDRLGRAASETTVAVRGDSQLVIQQVTGRWKVKHPELQPLHLQAKELLRGFGRSDIAWHRRDASVRVLGH